MISLTRQEEGDLGLFLPNSKFYLYLSDRENFYAQIYRVLRSRTNLEITVSVEETDHPVGEVIRVPCSVGEHPEERNFESGFFGITSSPEPSWRPLIHQASYQECHWDVGHQVRHSGSFTMHFCTASPPPRRHLKQRRTAVTSGQRWKTWGRWAEGIAGETPGEVDRPQPGAAPAQDQPATQASMNLETPSQGQLAPSVDAVSQPQALGQQRAGETRTAPHHPDGHLLQLPVESTMSALGYFLTKQS